MKRFMFILASACWLLFFLAIIGRAADGIKSVEGIFGCFLFGVVFTFFGYVLWKDGKKEENQKKTLQKEDVMYTTKEKVVNTDGLKGKILMITHHPEKGEIEYFVRWADGTMSTASYRELSPDNQS